MFFKFNLFSSTVNSVILLLPFFFSSRVLILTAVSNMQAWKWNSLIHPQLTASLCRKTESSNESVPHLFFEQMVKLSIVPPSVMCDSHHGLKYNKKRKQPCGLHHIAVLGTVHKGSSHKKPLGCTDFLCVVMEVSTASQHRDMTSRQL